jgi:hypothetical protein
MRGSLDCAGPGELKTDGHRASPSAQGDAARSCQSSLRSPATYRRSDRRCSLSNCTISSVTADRVAVRQLTPLGPDRLVVGHTKLDHLRLSASRTATPGHRRFSDSGGENSSVHQNRCAATHVNNRQKIHLSEAKRCSDKASHLSGQCGGADRVSASQCPTNCRRWASGDPDELGSRMPSEKLLSQQSPRARSSWHQGPMSADARLQERPISNTILPRPRRTPEPPLLSISHVPTRSRRYTALSLHAPDSPPRSVFGKLLEREALPPENVVPSRLES